VGHDITILTLADRQRWEDAEEGAVPAQCWRYSAALVKSGHEPRLAIVDADGSRLLLPFIERSWNGHTDVATVPGLSGASVVPASASPLTRWRAFATSQGWVSGYIQLAAETHPNVPADIETVLQTEMFLLDTCAWDLRRSASRIIHRKVARALQLGAVVMADDRAALTAGLQRLYPDTLARFGGRLQLSPDTLDEWSLDPRNLLIGVALNGVVEAVHLIHTHGRSAELHLAGVSEIGRGLSALLYSAGIERLKAMGVRRLNLGGAHAGLHMFKSWLGGTPVPLRSVRQVYDRARYASLCAAAGVGSDEAWFPAYRASRPPGLT
jgi:hypothetical protein